MPVVYPTPHWRTVYVSRQKRNVTRIEEAGKKLKHWEFDGEVRAWDLDTGRLRETFKHNPPRDVLAMRLAPNGLSFSAAEQLSGEGERWPKRADCLTTLAAECLIDGPLVVRVEQDDVGASVGSPLGKRALACRPADVLDSHVGQPFLSPFVDPPYGRTKQRTRCCCALALAASV